MIGSVKSSTCTWVSIVEHDRKEDCIDVTTSQAFFKHYNLDTVAIQDLGTYANFKDFNVCLLKHHDTVSRSTMEDHHQGAVVYFER